MRFQTSGVRAMIKTVNRATCASLGQVPATEYRFPLRFYSYRPVCQDICPSLERCTRPSCYLSGCL